jgi:hypothetical protein
MSKFLMLQKDRLSIVDDELFEDLNKHKWYVDNGGSGYVVRATYANGKQTKHALHRVIAGAKIGQQVDHINHDKLDNRACNLRCVTHTENQRNRSIRKDSSSGHIGVYFIAKNSKWRAQIYAGRNINLGYFKTFEEAVSARKAADITYGFHPNHGNKAPGKECVFCE